MSPFSGRYFASHTTLPGNFVRVVGRFLVPATPLQKFGCTVHSSMQFPYETVAQQSRRSGKLCESSDWHPILKQQLKVVPAQFPC